jgi:hypothetical protein
MDAAQLGMAGGCAYFVISWLGMFSYNLITGEAKLVELMRPGWGANFTWLSPQPTIAPIQELKQKTRRSLFGGRLCVYMHGRIGEREKVWFLKRSLSQYTLFF